MKLLALIVVPILVGFVGYFAAIAETARPAAVLHAVKEAELKPPPRPVTYLVFTGDLMLDRGIAKYAHDYGDDALLAGVKDLFAGADAIIPNLEGTITTLPSVASHDDLRFTFDPHFAPWLQSLGVTAVSLSNNHTDDFGGDGLLQTRQYLDAANIAYFGSPDNLGAVSTTTAVDGKRVCFVGYEGFIRTDPAPLAAEVARLRPNCDYLVATMHAGDEYKPYENALQQSAAHAFIDAGADVVIGSHPHVVEPLELYRGKPIFYSLGNFLFDQDFSWETEHGLALRVALRTGEAVYTLVPITIDHGRTTLSHDDDVDKTLSALITVKLSTTFADSVKSTHEFTAPYGIVPL